ncbi:hypothetical protein [Catenulispora subtropica]|uniref:Uncharacterized protein n=1 Tax=Catenulispora subtropica TaxID=450798 RepID=A0ABN2SX33_9ACTN
MTFNTEADLGAVERDEWLYAPTIGVGPLRFGMSLDEVVKTAGTFGPTKVSECVRHHSIFAPIWRVEVHHREVAASPPAVTGYVSQAVGLFCIASDAVHGPQVAFDGLRLVGKDLAELESDTIAYAETHDVGLRYTPEGYAGPDDPGIVLRAQRVGLALRSRPLFIVTRDGANTEWDSMPSEEYRLGNNPQPNVV